MLLTSIVTEVRILYHFKINILASSIAKSPAQPTNNAQQTVIQRDSLELGQELGVGEFGSVLKGVWTNPAGEKVNTSCLLLD